MFNSNETGPNLFAMQHRSKMNTFMKNPNSLFSDNFESAGLKTTQYAQCVNPGILFHL